MINATAVGLAIIIALPKQYIHQSLKEIFNIENQMKI